MFSILSKYTLPLALGALCMCLAALALSWRANATQRAEIAALRGTLATCSARVTNIIEDRKSDDEIDNLDLRSFTVPDGWLRPED